MAARPATSRWPRALCLLALTAGCDQEDAAPAAMELPAAPSATGALGEHPELRVAMDALSVDGRRVVALRGGYATPEAVDDRKLRGLDEALRRTAGATLVLRADARIPAPTVRSALRSATDRGVTELRVAVRGRGGEDRALPVRLEEAPSRPHLRVEVGNAGVEIKGAGFADALEEACGALPPGPVQLRGPEAWDWAELPACRARAARAVLADTGAGSVVIAAQARWSAVVHALDRLRDAGAETLILQ